MLGALQNPGPWEPLAAACFARRLNAAGGVALAAALAWAGVAAAQPARPAAKQPVFSSPVITPSSPGRQTAIDVNVAGAKNLYLVVTDGGDGFGCDWANWIEPRLVADASRGNGAKADAAELKLTDLKWKSAVSGWGQPRVNFNCEGGPLKVDGKPVAYGLGTHAVSVIHYELPSGYARFRAAGGLDDGGANQSNCRSSVRFEVFTEKPPVFVAASAAKAPGSREPADAVAGLDVAEGLQAQLFASEPSLLSLTNLDIDHKGRVWVCEVVNYRRHNGKREEGDRILILEDKDGDGKADETKVFYQGRDIDSAMGICVLGDKVIVSCSPNIFVFTDENGDDRPDKKELLFTKTGAAQHDHSAHSFVFGPDGKLYWNFGNTGQSAHDRDGKPVIDLAGNKVVDNGKPYWGGMPFRCNLDGSEFEVLGHNFRNNYEAAVDSFGALWQSDNDDDGNRGVRINYVMEFGNYGYREEFTGAGWNAPRTNLEAEIPLRHWHLNDPGVVPNFVQTGAGSPTGILVYEGRLLPKPFWDQVIHCDAGPNVVRAYPATKTGAGYRGEILNVLHGARDNWFRPADVCAAPDGSLFVTDWYDPGVGGHNMQDLERGRLFRVAPPNTPYRAPKFDFTTAAGAVEALQNPNLAARYLAYTALRAQGAQAEPELLKLYDGSTNDRMRARALWLLGKIEGRGRHYVDLAAGDKSADLRVTAVRLARQLKLDVVALAGKLAGDPAPEVLRECALALRGENSPAAARAWSALAARHDGQDRWYLEALGIGAGNRWDDCLDAWLDRVGGDWNTPAGRDILWRSRAAKTPSYLAKIILDAQASPDDLPRYLRAFDFLKGPTRDAALVEIAFAEIADEGRRSLVTVEAFKRLQGFDTKNLGAALDKALAGLAGTSQFVALVEKFGVEKRYPDLLALAQAAPESQAGMEAMRALLAKGQSAAIAAALADSDVKKATSTVTALGSTGDTKTNDLLLPLLTNARADGEARRQAARALARNRAGALRLLALAQAKQVEADVLAAAAFQLRASPSTDVAEQAAKLFPDLAGRDAKPLPPPAELLTLSGDVARGKALFAKEGQCAKCHKLGDEGKEVGPGLAEIGGKLNRAAILESILYPNAGISHSYETHALALADGNVVTGLLVSETPDMISLKNEDALVRTFKKSEVEQHRKLKTSLMPADLQKNLSAQDLIDIVDYLTTLKK